MKFYSTDSYIVSKDFELNEGYIYDYRINAKTLFNEHCNYKIIKEIVNSSNCSIILKKIGEENSNALKYNLKFLYDNDLLMINRPFAKYVIYKRNLTSLVLKVCLVYLSRVLLTYFLLSIILKILNINNLNLKTSLVVLLSILLHEIGHIIAFYKVNGFKLNCYVSINYLDISVITPILKRFDKAFVALTGPLLGAFFLLVITFLTNNMFYLIFVTIHLSMLIPIFDDGKELFDFHK